MRRNDIVRLKTLAVLLLVLGSCGQPDEAAETTTATTVADTVTTTTTRSTTGPTMGIEVPEDILNQLVSDAASRTGVAGSEMRIALARRVTWNDGALGCPEPGVMYTQALVDGYQVVLIAGSEALDYRVDDAGAFRVCEQPAGPVSDVAVPDPIAPTDAVDVVDAAREDLSRILDRPADSFVEESAGFVGAAAENPCQPTQLDRRDEEAPMLQAYEVVLRSGEAAYRYVATGGRLYLCQITPAGGK